MSARPTGSATVTFGLVTVPVRLYSATEADAGVSFHLLHRKCGTRVKQQYVCPTDAEVLTREDMAKGYEVAKDQYVTFTAEELDRLAEATSPGIEIHEFVPLAKVDPVFLEGAYYLAPDKGGEGPYALLAEALRRTDRCALGRWSARGKQHLVSIRAGAGRELVLQVLHFANEVRALEEIPLGDPGKVKEGELKLAMQLIKKSSSEAFRPEAYEDDVRKRYLAAIEKKKAGAQIQVEAAAAARPATTDLMQALKASLKAGPRRARRAA